MRAWPAPLLVISALVLACAAAAQPFGRSGPEFRVNTATTGYQEIPAVGMDAAGGFLVSWHSHFEDLLARRYAASGAPLGGEFRVNSSTTTYDYHPSVSGSTAGHFTVVWESSTLDHPTSILARRFLDGVPQGDAFRVDTTTSSFDQRPAVASSGNGDFVVIWGRSPNASNNWDLQGQRLAAAGTPLGSEFHVSTLTTTQGSGAPSVARRSDGAFLAVWTPNTFPAAVGRVFARAYDASGVEGPIFSVNADTAGGGVPPAAAYDSSGNFVVVWGGGFVWGQRYDAAGTALGDNFRVDTSSPYPPIDTRVGCDSAGNFVVVWNTSGTYPIYARRFASSGAPIGDQFRVNTTTSGEPRLGGMAMSGAGNFVVVWNQGGFPGADVFGQRFCATLAGDANGSGTLDVSDVFYLINALFAGGPAPLKSSDANGDGSVNVSDVFYLINDLFAGGPGPACAA